MMDRRAFYDNFGDLPHTADMAEVLARWRGQTQEEAEAFNDPRRCVRCRDTATGPDLPPTTLEEGLALRNIEPRNIEEELRPGPFRKAAGWGAAMVAGASLLVAGSVYARDFQAASAGAPPWVALCRTSR